MDFPMLRLAILEDTKIHSEDMADSLHLEAYTSVSLVHVQKISNKARIITVSSEIASTSGIIKETGNDKVTDPIINFNGSFHDFSLINIRRYS